VSAIGGGCFVVHRTATWYFGRDGPGRLGQRPYGAAFVPPLRSHPALMLALGFGPLLFVLIPVLESWRFARRYQPMG
jgi:hypothetical protein